MLTAYANEIKSPKTRRTILRSKSYRERPNPKLVLSSRHKVPSFEKLDQIDKGKPPETLVKIENDGGNEIIYILPRRAQDMGQTTDYVVSKQSSRIMAGDTPNKREQSKRRDSRNPTLLERLVRSRNIWCFPNMDRNMSEELLKDAEHGNFVLRASNSTDAMVLSRATSSQSNHSNGNKPEQTVEHHIITVLPRSGYCLAGDKTAHLVFGSVIHLLHFYIRLSSRRPGTEGPFLQLPRSIMEAKTMNDLDHLNRQGIDFWSTRLVNDTRRELVDQTSEHRRCSTAPQTSPEPPKRRLRPNSVDRRADKQDDLDHFLRRIVADRQSRETRPDEKTLGSNTISRPGSRLRASSVSAHDNVRQPLCKVAKELPSHMDGYASENSVWPATKQAVDSNQSGARSVQLIERLPLPMTDRFQTVRCSAGKTGIYEGEQSEFWRSVQLKNLPRKSSTDSTTDYQNMMSKNPSSQKMFTTECPRDHEQMPCPPPPRYAPNGVSTTVPSCTDSAAGQSSTVVNLWPSRPHRIITGLLCRTLDEHLRSIEAAEHLQSKKHKVTTEQNGNGHKIQYPPVTTKETLEKRTSNPSSDPNIGIHNVVSVGHNSAENHTPGTSVFAKKETDPVPDSRKFSSNDPTKQLLEYPTPKSVGRVFVMEAATYSSDDYEFLSETGTPSPFIPPAQTSNQGNYHSEDEKQSNSPVVKATRLRRAATTREGQRKFPLGSGDDVGVRNRHAVLLDDWERWKMVNVHQSLQENWPKNETETSQQNHTSADKPATVQSNLKVFFCPQTPLDEQPSPKPRKVKTLRTESTLKADDGEPVTEKSNGVDCTSKQDYVLSDASKPELTVVTTPKSSGPSEADALPTLRNPQCRRLTADDSERRDSTSELGPSPSTSSRASTVFCLPWDSAPFGGYLSDLINLAGSGNGSGSRKELVYRRRTMSGLDRRYPIDRLSVGQELSASSADSHNKAEFQRLLLLWMQTNGNAGATADTLPGTATDSPSPNHPPVATDNRRTNIPPPIPRRRSRHSNSVRQSPFAHPSETSTVSDISPYAVTVCPSKSQFSKDHECQSKQKPFQGTSAVDPNEGSDVYDEAFCGNDEDVLRRTDPVPIHTQSSSRIPTPLSKLESTFCGSAPGSTPNMPIGDRPPNYVYAQVIPRHLRNHSESDSGSEKKQSPQKTSTPEKSNFISKFGHDKQQRAYVEIDDAFYADGYGCTTLGAGGMPLCSTVDNYYRPNPLLSSKSNSSLSDYSSQSSSHSNLGGESSTLSSARFQTSQTSRKASPGRPTEVKQSGWYIRKFLQRLIKDKTGEVAEQIGLFIECTRASSDRGPYRTMQSIRQFINGMTNYLMRNPKLGLSEAVNKEKEQLSDYGFLNVGAILETTLQKYVLRPLHRHVIRQLKREQIRHNELESVRAKIHLARCSPSDSLPPSYGVSKLVPCPTEATVQRVNELFRQMESHYAVSRKMSHLSEIFTVIRDEVNSRISTHNIQLSSEDYHPIYAWTLARAGLLLAPLIPDPINSDQSCPTKAAFCPAALQADYLDGLLTKSQLSNQAIDQCSLNDLFGTLYWVWSRSTTQSELQRGNSAEHLISSDLESPRTPHVDVTPNGGFTSNFQQCAMLPPPPVSMQHPDHFKSVKRRIIPPSRRKTVTTVQHPRASPVESQSGSPVAGSKFDFVSKIPVNPTLQRAASKQSVRSYSMETEQAVTIRSGDVEHLSARWRPWAPSVSGSSLSTTAGSVREQPLVRVLVMDEKTNQMRSQFYPVRPSLTASELCNILAFRMKIFDPKEFGLFMHIEGREIPLDDSLRIADFIDTTQADVFDLQHLTALRSNMSTPGSVKDLPTIPLTMNTTHTSAPSASSGSGSPSPLETTMNRTHKPNRSIPCVVAPSWWSAWKRKGAPFGFDRKPSSSNITHDAAELVGQAPTAIDTGTRASKTNTKPVMIYRRTSGYFAISDRALSDDNSSMS